MANGEGGDPGASEGFVQGLFNSLKEWTSGLFGSLISDITSAFSQFGNLLGNLGTTTKNGFSVIGGFISNFTTILTDLFKSVFVPEEGYFSDKFDYIKETINTKFAFIGQTKEIFPNNFSDYNTFVLAPIKFMGFEANINLEWYNQYSQYIKNFLSGGVVILTIMATYKRFRPQYVTNG